MEPHHLCLSCSENEVKRALKESEFELKRHLHSNMNVPATELHLKRVKMVESVFTKQTSDYVWQTSNNKIK